MPQTTPTTRQVKRATAIARQTKTTQHTTGTSPVHRGTRLTVLTRQVVGQKAKAMSPMQHILRRPLGRIALGIAALLVVAVGATAYYIFGGGAPAKHAPVTAPTFAPTANGTIFTLDSSASEASFTLQETLRGQPNTVVGKTNQVAGQILINKQDPAKSQVGQIKVDLSTLVTDDDQRNHTLQSRIFETDDSANVFASFTSQSLTGLPTTPLAVGQTVSFRITGNLTIHQTTHSETFDVRATVVSQSKLTGTAQTTVNYQDFNLAVPNVPFVAVPSQDVQLALTFTAAAQA
jgi:polyisoprenoid-binding protein YceI